MKKIGLLFSALLIVALAAAWLVPTWAVADVEAEACTKSTHPTMCRITGGVPPLNSVVGIIETSCYGGKPPFYSNCGDCCFSFGNNPECEAIVGSSQCYCTIAAGVQC